MGRAAGGLSIDNSGNSTFASNVYVGSATTNGGVINLIQSTTNPEIRIQSGESGATAFSIYNTATNPDAEQFFINNNLSSSHLGNARGALKLEDSSGTALTLSSGNATFAGRGIFSDNVQIVYTGSKTNDAGLYIQNDSDDWGIHVNKNTNNFGIRITSDGGSAFGIYSDAGANKINFTGTGNATFAGTVTATTFSGDLNGTINTATTGVTQTAGNNSTLIATTAYADAAAAAVPIGNYLPLAGGTLTGALAGTSASFTGALSSVGYSGTSGTFSASVTASGNSNNFGNTTTAALTATSGTFSASVTASGNSNTFGATTVTSNLTTNGVFTIQNASPYIQWKNVAGTRLSYIQHNATNLVMSADTGQIQLDTAANNDILINPGGTGNVGIGTTLPIGKLNVSKDSTTDGLSQAITVSSSSVSTKRMNLGYVPGSNYAFIDVINYAISNTNQALSLQPNGGNVGIGTTTPLAKLDIQGTQGQLFSVTDNLSGSIFAVADISGVPIFDVNSSGVSYFDGNVGIGTTSPDSKLHVLQSGNGTSSLIITEDNARKIKIGRDSIQCTDLSDSAANLYLNQAGGTVSIPAASLAIGATSPLGGLRVNGGTGDTVSQEPTISLTRTSSTGNVLVGKMILTTKPSDPTNHGNLVFQVKTTASSGENSAYYTNAITIDGNNANVGIGTDAPPQKLSLFAGTNESVYDVLGVYNSVTGTTAQNKGAAIRIGKDIDGNYSTKIATIYEGNNPSFLQPALAFYTMHNTYLKDSETEKMRISSNGNVGIGFTSPGSTPLSSMKLSVNGNGYFAGNVGIGVTGPQSKLHIETGSGGTYIPNASHDDVTIEGSGNIGLQLFSPNTTYQYIAFGDPDSVNAGYIRYHHGTNKMVLRTNGGDRLHIDSSGNVGIGPSTTSPAHKLEVRDGTISGEIAKFSAIGATVVIESSTAGNAKLFLKPNTTGSKRAEFRVTDANDYGFLWTADTSANGTAYMELEASSTGGGDLTVKGDVIAYGSPSDKKYKENIKPIESALDKAMKLQGVTFDWKDSESILEIKKDIGFIAQDVQEVLPELVRENKKGNLSLRYQGITPILLEAIKELRAEIEELKLNNCNCNK